MVGSAFYGGVERVPAEPSPCLACHEGALYVRRCLWRSEHRHAVPVDPFLR